MDRTNSFVILSYNHGCPPCYCHLHRQRDRDYHTKIHLRQRLRTDICKMLLAALKLYKKKCWLVLGSRFQLKANFLKSPFYQKANQQHLWIGTDFRFCKWHMREFSISGFSRKIIQGLNSPTVHHRGTYISYLWPGIINVKYYVSWKLNIFHLYFLKSKWLVFPTCEKTILMKCTWKIKTAAGNSFCKKQRFNPSVII